MRRRDNVITLFAILVVIVVIIGIVLLAFGPAEKKENNEPKENEIIPTNPPETDPPATPEVTETPEPVVTPPPTPEPTPEVTPEPVYVVDAKGSFSSNTGTYLNVRADWSAVSQYGNTAYLTIDLSVVHYSFFTSALPGSIVLKVGDEVINLGSPEISYDGNDQKTTKMASAKIEVPVGSTVPISVEWHYRGTYGGVELDVIELSGSAYIG